MVRKKARWGITVDHVDDGVAEQYAQHFERIVGGLRRLGFSIR